MSETQLPVQAIPEPVIPEMDEEPLSERRERQYMLSALWAVVLLGLPIWWSTTTTQRLSLPSAQVRTWRDVSTCCPITVPVWVSAPKSQSLQSLRQQSKGSNCSVRDCFDYQVASSANDADLFLDANDALTWPDGSAVELDSNQSDKIVKYAPRYTLRFSVLQQDGTQDEVPLYYNVNQYLNNYILPTCSALQSLHNFTIEVQSQFIAPLAFEPEQAESGTLIPEDTLKAFINAAEWNLASTASSDPVLHFLLYVPAKNARPMSILQQNGQIADSNAFIIPQWGGVYIFNPTDDLSLAFATFHSQLQLLLGLPRLSSSTPATWQIEALIRDRLIENAKEAVDTLGATVKLAKEIKNMRINTEVRNGVRTALASLDLMKASLPTSTSAALNYAVQASTEASKAFFHPSMLGLLYFPDEHKLAVYTPFFGPIALPIVAATLREVVAWRKRGKVMKVKTA